MAGKADKVQSLFGGLSARQTTAMLSHSSDIRLAEDAEAFDHDMAVSNIGENSSTDREAAQKTNDNDRDNDDGNLSSSYEAREEYSGSVQCEHCEKTFSSRQLLQRHMGDHRTICYRNRTNGARRATSTAKNGEPDGAFACSRCRATMNKKFSVERHIRDTCWKICDECVHIKTTTECDSAKLNSGCSGCEAKGIPCVRHSQSITGTRVERVTNEELDLQPRRRGPRPSTGRRIRTGASCGRSKRRAAQSPSASPEQVHVKNRIARAPPAVLSTEAEDPDGAVIPDGAVRDNAVVAPAQSMQARLSFMLPPMQAPPLKDFSHVDPQISQQPYPANMFEGTNPFSMAGLVSQTYTSESAASLLPMLPAVVPQARLPMRTTSLVDLNTIHPPESRVDRFRDSVNVAHQELPRARALIASAPTSRMQTPAPSPNQINDEPGHGDHRACEIKLSHQKGAAEVLFNQVNQYQRQFADQEIRIAALNDQIKLQIAQNAKLSQLCDDYTQLYGPMDTHRPAAGLPGQQRFLGPRHTNSFHQNSSFLHGVSQHPPTSPTFDQGPLGNGMFTLPVLNSQTFPGHGSGMGPTQGSFTPTAQSHRPLWGLPGPSRQTSAGSLAPRAELQSNNTEDNEEDAEENAEENDLPW